MTTAQGFVKFLELLPVMGVVQIHPHRKQYKSKICKQCKLTIKEPKRRIFCSTECHNVYWLQNRRLNPKIQTCALCKKEFNKITQLKYCSKECRVAAAERRRVTNDYSVERNCVVCKNTLPYGKATYCSDKCYKEQQYANVRNPFSTHGTGERASLLPYEPNVMPTHRVPPEILAQAELYVDCNADIDGAGGIKEDLDEINQIIMEENIVQPSRYRKEIRSPRESGKLYWSVKTIENRRREEAGLPKLSTMRYSNLEQQLRDHHDGKKKVVSIKEQKYQIEKHTKGFATITPMRTKSGKSFSEVMANAKRKQSMGST